MKVSLLMVAVGLLGAGCDVGGGKLTGAGGGTAGTGAGGSGLMTGRGGAIVTGIGNFPGGAPGTGAGGDGFPINPCGTTYGAARNPPDVLIVLDTSTSMNDAFNGPCANSCGPTSKWSAAVS